MSEAFDPYRKWLGIQPAEQPPDHYRLLGIVRFEDDADTISNAADRQMAHVRTFQTGPHSALSQKLLNEIAAARLCLLDAVRRGEYDRRLRAKEGCRTPPTVAASTEPMLRPIEPILVNPAVPAPIRVGPVARRPQTKIHLREPARERSEAHKTLLIAAGLAAVAVAVFAAYKTHDGAKGKVTRDEVASGNRLVEDDTEKAREVSESPEASRGQAVVTGEAMSADAQSSAPQESTPSGPPLAQRLPPQVVVESIAGPGTIWAKLTRQLNDIDSWKATSGQWSEKDGRLYGQGDSRLSFQEELPDAFQLSFDMTVVDGMRPRVFFFGDKNFHFGNEGYVRALFVHDGISLPILGAQRPYTTGESLKIACGLTEQEVEFLVDGELVARCRRAGAGPLKLTLSAGDSWSPGQVVFGSFTIGPAPPGPLFKLPRGTSSDSIDLLRLIDVPRDQINGDWKREGTALVSPTQQSARLQLPYSPGGDYELTVVVERLSGPESCVMGMVIGGRQVAMTLDGWGGETAGLTDLDHNDGATNESTRRGRRLPPGRPHTVVSTVHGNSVRVTCDGQEALAWSGDAARLSNGVFWEVPDKRRLYLGAWESAFKYTRVEIRPLPPEPPKEMRSAATPRAASNNGGWRDVFDGKSLAGWTGDVGLMRVEDGVLVHRGKRAVVVAPGDYHDFEIELEFRLTRDANSGLGICYPGSGDPSQNGLEVQMLDDGAHRRLRDNQRCGAIYGLAAAKPGHYKRWPEWNRLRVTSLEDVIRVELNGTLVTDTTRSLMRQANPQHAGVSRTSGKVCLFPIDGRNEYRQIRVRSAK